MIIGISGKAGSGKTESAYIISYLISKKELNYDISYEEYKNNIKKYIYNNIKLYSFSDRLKSITNYITNIDYNILNNDKTKLVSDLIEVNEIYRYKTVRNLLQDVGDFIRFINENMFVNYVMTNIDDSKINIIHDVRFANELEAIKNKNGLIIRIERQVKYDPHVSETQLDSPKYYNESKRFFDFVVDNNNDLNTLTKNLEDILRTINLI